MDQIINKWLIIKVHIFWEGHKILRNLPLTFDCGTYGQKLGEDFAKLYGLLRIYELNNILHIVKGEEHVLYLSMIWIKKVQNPFYFEEQVEKSRQQLR